MLCHPEIGKQTLHFGMPIDFPLKRGPEGMDESEMIIAGDVDALTVVGVPGDLT